MSQKNLSLWLKVFIIGVFIVLIPVYVFLIPSVLESYLESVSIPLLVISEATVLPVLPALYFSMKIAGNIGRDRSFSLENAALMKKIAFLSAGDGAFLFSGNLCLFFFGENHPGPALLSLLFVFLFIAVSVAAAALSHLILKAAGLQDESDLTI